MKRINNLHNQICIIENIEKADKNARKHKKNNWGIRKHDAHKQEDNELLLKNLTNLTYKTSEYDTFTIYEPKERLIYRLPYYPDRIAHHAIMNLTEEVWTKTFIDTTYACIKNRGIHKLATDIKKVLHSDVEGTKYCLKIDVKKFYPSIDHDVLKRILRKKIKDKKLLSLLDEIISSTGGVPIGIYLSQFFANLVLSYFDHWLKEDIKVKYYFRYADDIVLLSNNKKFLRKVLVLIKMYFRIDLSLSIKDNYQIFPVKSRGIDFVGYVFYHTHTLLRKSLKVRMFSLINKYKRGEISKEDLCGRMQAYFGWLKHCNSKHLLQNIEKETGIHFSNWNGRDSTISKFYNKNVHIVEVVQYSGYYKIHFIYKRMPYSVNSRNTTLYNNILKINKFPLDFKITNYVKSNKNNNKCRA